VAIPAGAEVEFEAEVLSHSPDVLDPKLAAEVSQAAPVLTVVAADSVANSSGKNYDTAGTQAVAAPASVLMSPEELVHYVDVQLRRTSGNRWYRWGDLARAGRCYSKAAEAAEKMIFPPQPDAAAIVQSRGQVLQEAPKERKVSRRWLDLYVASINNLAATHLQSGDALKAREACIKGLEVAPFNVTTLLRAGRASLQLHEYDEASLCFKRVLEIDPSNKAVGTDIAKLRRAVEQYKASRKAMSSRMVSKLFASSKGGQGLPGGGNSAPKECADEYEIVVKNNGTDTKEGSSVGDGSICGTGTEANAHSGAIDGSSTIEDFCPAVSEASGSQSASEELLLPRSPRSVASAAAAPSTGRKAATATEAHREPVQDGVKGESSGTGSDSSLIAVPELRRLVVLAAGVLGFAVGMAVLRM
jgi:tetratricopeptide (TPR) repeat protein